jgi:hypothetical protein
VIFSLLLFTSILQEIVSTDAQHCKRFFAVTDAACWSVFDAGGFSILTGRGPPASVQLGWAGLQTDAARIRAAPAWKA